MTTEQRRRDLYNGLTEVLGVERADTLMAHLPTHQYDDLATRKDMDGMSMRLDAVEKRLDTVEKRLDVLAVEMSSGFKEVGRRIDRLLLTVVAGMFAVVATLVVQGAF